MRALGERMDLEQSVRSLAAEVLQLPVDEVRTDVPLTRFGLDSMAAVELGVCLEDRLQCEVPEGVFLEHPSVRELAARITQLRENGVRRGVHDAFEQMLADSRLPEGLEPPSGANFAAPRLVLLTGATGFLGAYALAALLRETKVRAVCLVRGSDPDQGRERIRAALRHYGLFQRAMLERIEAIPANLALPDLGLAPRERERLAREADAICHIGAAVNWAAPYTALRAVNVRGTGELLRLACSHRAKSFHFLSSLAVCYSTSAPRQVSEDDDMRPHLRGIHLGYAQSKCVAESLVRDAGRRGLPVVIHRPALIWSDSRTGVCNSDDFLSVFFKGCIQMGCAPDLDWLMDCCPVDHVSDVVVRHLMSPGPGTRVLHLSSARRRHWREGVLWVNLYGYPLELVPYDHWARRLEQVLAAKPSHPLHSLRGFFLGRVKEQGDLTLPQIYEEGRRNRVSSAASRSALVLKGIDSPELSTGFLERTFASYVRGGHLAPVRSKKATSSSKPLRLDEEFFEKAIGSSVDIATRMSSGSDHSILTELTSWTFERTCGLFRCRLRARGRERDVMVKVKPLDREVMQVAKRVTRLCDEGLGDAYERFVERLGFVGCHHRELALYSQTDERFRRCTPQCLGQVRDEEREHWALVLEYLGSTELLDSADDLREWTPAHVEAAVCGLAELQSIWLTGEGELLGQPWIGHVLSASDMASMRPLWLALERFSRPSFEAWAGCELGPIRRELIESLDQWWLELEKMPRTLTHNDFNPRNLCFRRTETGPLLCAYDWELATVQVPQHDLAELLCFVLDPRSSGEDLLSLIELHRVSLQRWTGTPLDREEWMRGFQLSLHDLMVHRIPLYAVVDRFRRQRFLERVVRSWRRLFELSERGVRCKGKPARGRVVIRT